MADCSCDFCGRSNQCPYAYNESDCVVETIKSARVIADDEFKAFLANLEEKNEDLCDDNLYILIRTMRDIVCYSNETLPEWAMEEAKEQEKCVPKNI